MKDILFIAPPAGGKSTICSRLVQEYGYNHIATGDLLREVNPSSSLGKKIQSDLKSGSFVSDEIVIELLRKKLNEIKGKPFILDGFPRTIEQANLLDNILKDYDLDLELVINLNVTYETLLKRVTGRLICSNCNKTFNKFFLPPRVSGVCDNCNDLLITRTDDNETTFKVRYENYMKETYPLIEFYKRQGKLVSVDGENNIYENIVREINND